MAPTDPSGKWILGRTIRESYCNNENGDGPRYEMAPMPEAVCVWFPIPQASFSFFDGQNIFPEFYAVGTASGHRGTQVNC